MSEQRSGMEEALRAVREKQARQLAEYARQPYFRGEAVELPWEEPLPLRFHLHRPSERPEGRMKVFFNLHGGGFIEGDAVLMGTLCQKLADRLGILVVNVNYRLSPDFLYPYQCREIDAIYDWLSAHAGELNLEMAHCGIGGFSAGATIALNSIVRWLLAGERRYTCCVLGYPMVSADPRENDADSPYPAADELMMRVITYYFNGQGDKPECSALLADEALLAQFPGVVEITCGRDSLGPQGRRFAAKLAAAGVRLDYANFANALHGFIEVNRDDYDPNDPRRTPEQAALNEAAEEFIIRGLASML